MEPIRTGLEALRSVPSRTMVGPSFLLVLWEVGSFAQLQSPSVMCYLTTGLQATEPKSHVLEPPKL